MVTFPPPLPLLSVSPTLSVTPAQRQSARCQLLPALGGCVEHFPLSPGNRHVRSPPPGSWCECGGQGVGGDQFFSPQLSVYKQTRTRYEALGCLCYIPLINVSCTNQRFFSWGPREYGCTSWIYVFVLKITPPNDTIRTSGDRRDCKVLSHLHRHNRRRLTQRSRVMSADAAITRNKATCERGTDAYWATCYLLMAVHDAFTAACVTVPWGFL